ncbi:MAG TPA: GNAT family N-acetyltransferase [Kofleriaceae bacterium]|jgi:hypothetical protein
MEPVDLAACADDFDRAVSETPGIDRFCSSSAWVLAANTALMPPRAPFAYRGKSGYFAAAQGVHPAGFQYIEPLELAWGLASPLAGADSRALCEEIIGVLLARRDWRLAIFAGLAETGPQRKALDRLLPPSWEQRLGKPTVRHVASLEGGVDGFLSRRSRELRKSLRKSQRAAAANGLTFEDVRVNDVAGATALYARIQAVEANSWKSRDGVGIADGPMRDFYGLMLPRLAVLGQQRTVFARAGQRDVGYILGAVQETEYRGLQFSYADDLAKLGVGSLLQFHQIEALCEQGVTRYDLGTSMDYKLRWAEEIMETEMLVLVR